MAIADHPGAGRWGPGQSINRQLHDLVVPQLFVLSTGLAALRRREFGGPNEALVSDLAEVATQALADLRSISRGQPVHEGGDLTRVATRLRLATETVARLTDTDVEFSVTGEAAVPAALEDDLVAVTWECIANAIRHGEATRVGVELRADAASLSVVVTDDGQWSNEVDTASSGLAGLRDRAATWHGRAVVDHSDAATRVVWRVPLDTSGRPLTPG